MTCTIILIQKSIQRAQLAAPGMLLKHHCHLEWQCDCPSHTTEKHPVSLVVDSPTPLG